MDGAHVAEVSVRVARPAMRVRFEIVLFGADPVALQAAGEEALDEICRVESDLSPYLPTSDLFAANAGAGRHPVRVLATTLSFLERAQALCTATGGLFDPTVGPLMRVWGLTGDAAGRIPTPEEITAACACVGMGERVRLDGESGTVSFDREGVLLDPGAIGKGWALDRAGAVLRDCGVARALLHGGTSSVLAIGGPWEVAIAGRDGVPARTVSLSDGALGVSAPSGKEFEREGKRYGHVLDPRSGRPVPGAGIAAVEGPSATDCDAYSTALLVAGDEWTAALPSGVMGFVL